MSAALTAANGQRHSRRLGPPLHIRHVTNEMVMRRAACPKLSSCLRFRQLMLLRRLAQLPSGDVMRHICEHVFFLSRWWLYAVWRSKDPQARHAETNVACGDEHKLKHFLHQPSTVSYLAGGGLKNWELSRASWWQGVHGSWLQSQSAELSSLLASSVVLASLKCLPSQGSGAFWSRNSGLSSLLVSPVVLASQRGSAFCFPLFFFLFFLGGSPVWVWALRLQSFTALKF